MGEPINRSRAAAPGKFCVWIEEASGQEHRHADQFDTHEDAKDVAERLLRADKLGRIDRVLVYNDEGCFEHKWVR